jgi:hypothetical protein
MPLLLLPSTTATIDNTLISIIGSIPLLPPSTTTAIAPITAINYCHCRHHTINNNNRQKPAIVVCCQQRQWRSLFTEAVVDGGHGNGGLCQQGLLLWR